MSEFEKYKRALEADLARYKANKASCERSISRLEEKIANAEKWFEKETTRGTKRARVARGEEFAKRVPPTKRKNEEASSSPAKTDDVPAAPKKEKSFFEKLAGGGE